MVVLQFAWGGGPANVHLPHMHYDNCFCYPGTHDNETAVGWFNGRWVGGGVGMAWFASAWMLEYNFWSLVSGMAVVLTQPSVFRQMVHSLTDLQARQEHSFIRPQPV